MAYRFQYSANIQQIISIQKDINSFKDEWKLSEVETRQVIRVIEELFSKLIKNSCPDGVEHTIVLVIENENGTFIFSMQENGAPFNPFDEEMSNPNANLFSDTDAISITLIKSFINSYEYIREDEKNRFTFRKTLKGSGN